MLLTLAPALELRASIPYGLLHSDLSPWTVIAVCVVCNIALAPLVWLFMAEGVHLVVRIKPIGRLYDLNGEYKKALDYYRKYIKYGGEKKKVENRINFINKQMNVYE